MDLFRRYLSPATEVGEDAGADVVSPLEYYEHMIIWKQFS